VWTRKARTRKNPRSSSFAVEIASSKRGASGRVPPPVIPSASVAASSAPDLPPPFSLDFQSAFRIDYYYPENHFCVLVKTSHQGASQHKECVR
jgi:hypothetical protein